MASLVSNRETGNYGENLAVDYLCANGHNIIARNYYTRYGEIDIITNKHSCIYFYEVKYRKNDGFGSGEEAISRPKLEKIKKSIAIWISKESHRFPSEEYFLNALVLEYSPKLQIIEYEVF